MGVEGSWQVEKQLVSEPRIALLSFLHAKVRIIHVAELREYVQFGRILAIPFPQLFQAPK